MKRHLLGFIVLNIIVALLTALAALLVWRAARPAAAPPQQPTPVMVFATVTPPPNVTVVVVTPAPLPPTATATPVATHVVQPGENCSTIAEAYGVALGALLRINNLDGACLIYPGDVVSIPGDDVDAPTDEEAPPRDGVITYTVQPGDTVFGIAAYFDLRPESLFWANQDTLTDVHLLAIGQELTIPPVDGVLHVASGSESVAEIAAQYEVALEVILTAAYNNLARADADSRPRPGAQIMIPGAEGEVPEDLFQQAVQDAEAGAPEDAGQPGAVSGGFAPGHPGSCGWVHASYGGTGAFQWPLPSFSVWADFADPWHRGIDLGGVPGTPVRAADNGTVIFAGWNNWGYGNMVVLDHGNGFWTLYAHLDQVRLRCGQGVNGGQLVGTLGTTGSTAGPHVHFEIRQGGVPVNPHEFIH
ncbi:MAG: LysM peptidoglycan-binding domain-containing M23 family metallopeptidase [Anaerolineae bacterium]|nr:LysM peptidoglycan-binding domain-containing M23 family metallopeptidase [Anaerolineae bacterium]